MDEWIGKLTTIFTLCMTEKVYVCVFRERVGEGGREEKRGRERERPYKAMRKSNTPVEKALFSALYWTILSLASQPK